MAKNQSKQKLLITTIIWGIASLILFILFFSNQSIVIKYFTKAKWYDWEDFIQLKQVTAKEKSNLIKQSILAQNNPVLSKKMKDFQKKINKTLRKSSRQNPDRDEFIKWIHFTINLTKAEKTDIKKQIVIARDKKPSLLKENTLLAALKYALLPILTAFLFSFIHGAFASNLWSFLGIEAIKRKET